MGIRMEKPLGEMTLAELTDRCTHEMSKYRRKESGDDSYCLEILRRAVILQNQDAWAVLRRQFRESTRLWMRRHPSKETAMRYSSEDDYVDDAFSRFWHAVRKQEQSFTSIAGALSYLHLCLNCAIMDTLRSFARPNVEVLPDYGHPDEPLFEDHYHEEELWEAIESVLTGEKEKTVAHLHFYCNLKPREIIRYCPGTFSGEDEIYRLRRNIMEKIVRNADRIRWKLSEEERM